MGLRVEFLRFGVESVGIRVGSCITQLKAQGTSRICKESTEGDKEELGLKDWGVGCRDCLLLDRLEELLVLVPRLFRIWFGLL